jgi:hypothetical protein
MSSNLFDRLVVIDLSENYENIIKEEKARKTARLSDSDETGNFLSIFVNGQEVFYGR